MSAHEKTFATTTFCRSKVDGSIAPNWGHDRDPELQGQFEVGLTVADRYLLTQTPTELPDSGVFLIHPALDTFIRAQRSRSPFLQFQHIPVGENLLWEPYFPAIMQIEKQLQKITDRPFTDLAHVVVKRVQSLLTSGPTPLGRIEIETSEEGRTLGTYETNEACAETILWLEELLGTL